MRPIARALVCVLVSAAPLFVLPQVTTAAQTNYWPQDAEERLSQLEPQALDKMRELSAAQLRGDGAAAEHLTKELKELQGERFKLLRATQRLPR